MRFLRIADWDLLINTHKKFADSDFIMLFMAIFEKNDRTKLNQIYNIIKYFLLKGLVEIEV